jgi:hypothetical protein
MSLIIEQGIVRDTLHGSVLAWKFMASQGVPDALIARVLAYPAERRRSDSPAHHGQGRPPVSNDAPQQPLPD